MYSMCCKSAQCTNVSAWTHAQFSDLKTVLQVWELMHICCFDLSRSKTSSNNFTQTFSAVVTASTNHEIGRFGSLATSTVADNTVVAPFIGLLHTRDGQCSTIRPLCRTRLPLPLLSWIPLPVIAHGVCSSGLDSQYHSFAWADFLRTIGVNSDLGRFI